MFKYLSLISKQNVHECDATDDAIECKSLAPTFFAKAMRGTGIKIKNSVQQCT